MAYKVSKECREQVNSWLDTLEEGDNLRVCNGEMVIINSLGCEINRFDIAD